DRGLGENRAHRGGLRLRPAGGPSPLQGGRVRRAPGQAGRLRRPDGRARIAESVRWDPDFRRRSSRRWRESCKSECIEGCASSPRTTGREPAEASMDFDSFHGSAGPSLGVELEFQLVDARSLALTKAADLVLAGVPTRILDAVKPEFYESCV